MVASMLSFAALTVPLDIKLQYAEERLREIIYVGFEQEENLARVYIEFENETFDEWELPLLPNNGWLGWFGWNLSDSGEIEPE